MRLSRQYKSFVSTHPLLICERWWLWGYQRKKPAFSVSHRPPDVVRSAAEPLTSLLWPSGRSPSCLASCRLVLALSHPGRGENQPSHPSAGGHQSLSQTQRPAHLCRASHRVTDRGDRGGSAGWSGSSTAAWPLLFDTQVSFPFRHTGNYWTHSRDWPTARIYCPPHVVMCLLQTGRKKTSKIHI